METFNTVLMRKIIFAAIFTVFTVMFIATPAASQQQMWVTGYWPVWAYPMTPEKANWTGLTHVIHFSANPVQTSPYLDVLVSATDSMKMENNGSDVGQVNRLISNAHAHGVKVLLSLGGIYGTGATNMTFICSDSARVDTFATASAAYALRRGYDGIEVDWEPPSSAVASARLYRLIRRELNKWPVRGQLAVAIANNDNYSPFTKFYDTQELLNDVDQCNVMMYDMHLTPSYSGSVYDVTAYNAPLNPPGPAYPIIDQYSWNYDPGKGHTANAGVRLWNAEGMPYSKMAAGIPFYGYLYKGKTAPNQARGTVWPQYISYKDIMFALSHGGTYHWDSTARVPWISGTATAPISWYATTGDQFYITFDDTNSVREKVNWAKKLGLGGIMIYELYMGWNDTAAVRDPLLRALNNAMGGMVTPSDSIPPTITLTAPSNGDSITAGTVVTLSATAGDNLGVAGVTFLVNGTTVSTTPTSPYTCSWQTTGLSGAQTVAARAVDGAGNSTTSSAVTIYVKYVPPPVPGAPVQTTPSDGAVNQPVSPTVNWNAVTGAAGYRVQVSANASFSPVLLDDSTLTGTSRSVPTLTNSSTYFWRVNAHNATGTGPWSGTRSFTVTAPVSAGDLTLYQDALNSPWSDASWSATNTLLSAEQQYTGAYSIKSVDAAWGGLQLWSRGNSVTPSAYANLEVAVYTTTSNIILNAFLTADTGTAFASVKTASLPVNQWVVLTFPMSSLNPSNTPFTHVGFQNFTGTTATVYFDNIHFNSYTPTSIPSVPVILTPAAGATAQSIAPLFTWNPSAGAAGYRLQLSQDSLFGGTLLVDDSTLTSTSELVTGLAYTTTYYWRVNARNSLGVSDFSPVAYFTTDVPPPDPPLPASPTNGTSGLPVTTTVSWQTITTASAYQLQVSTDSTFGGTLSVNDSTLTTTSKQLSSLSYNTAYYWRVRAKNSEGCSSFSQAWKFKTASAVLPGGSALVVYQDSLNAPWLDASWASSENYYCADRKFSGQYSIKALVNPWGGLEFWTGGSHINPALYSSLEFAVYTPTNGMTLNLFAGDAGVSGFPSGVRKNIPARRWVTVTCLMSQLNPRMLAFSYFGIQNFTGSPTTFYIDNIHFNASGSPGSIYYTGSIPDGTPSDFELEQNYPNPANPQTMIRYGVPEAAHVQLTVYNMIGQQVAQLVNEVKASGYYQTVFDGTGLPSGVYFYRITAGEFAQTRKLVLMK